MRALAAITACALAAIAIGAGDATAAPVALSEFPASDGLTSPESIAVDRATGDVYVLNPGTGGESIARFDSSGRPLAFSASESYVIANELFGTPSESFAFESPSAAQVAVSESGGPLGGDVYVTDSHHHFVDVFSSTGEYLGQLNGSGTPQLAFHEVCGVAVDGAGRVYVADTAGFIERYTPKAATMPVGDSDYEVSEISYSGLGEICAVAADPAGDVYGSTWSSGPLNEFAASQFPASGSVPGTPQLIASTSHAVAVDPASGDVYVDEGGQVSVYETSGTEPKLLESFGSLSGESHGVAVGSGGRVYVSDLGPLMAEQPALYVFGPPTPSAPAVVNEGSANVSAGGAELQAQINPDFADTTYRFQYGTSAAYGGEVPLTPLDAGAGGGLEGARRGTVQLQGLTPDTTYHYRVVAKNEIEETFGADATFTTTASPLSGGLPDGRVWELVSPPEKEASVIGGIDGATNGNTNLGDEGLDQAAEDGEAVAFQANGAFQSPAGAPLVGEYLARRGAQGWSTQNLDPAMVAGTPGLGVGTPYAAFSGDLSQALLSPQATGRTNPSAQAGREAPPGYEDFFVRDNLSETFRAVFTTADPPTGPPEKFKARFEGASSDLRHIVVATHEALTPHARGNLNDNLYEWSAAGLEVVNILPGETESWPEAILGQNNAGEPSGINPVSSDGRIVYFTDLPPTSATEPYPKHHLYVRIDGERTVRVDKPEQGPEPPGSGEFQAASSDGSTAFFLDTDPLTPGASAEPGARSDLYSFSPSSGQVSDLTGGLPAGRHADVQQVVGISGDGSYVYFIANGVLAPGATQGNCYGTKSQAQRRCNLYVWHAQWPSPIRFIASLSSLDNTGAVKAQSPDTAADWAVSLGERTVRVSPDGRYLVFMARESLTGYDSRSASTGEPQQEVYLYDAARNALTCVSCRPSGARPTGPSSIPAWSQYEKGVATYPSRVLSDTQGGGRVFFDSLDAIVPQAVNGHHDVYEWEEDGVGGCRQEGGCVSLISGGVAASDSWFLDASVSGNDVFFITPAQLVPQDTDELRDVYDARVGGGFPAPSVPPPACEGENCKAPPPPEPSAFATPASFEFVRSGNAPVATPAHHATVKRHKRARRRGRSARGRRRRPARRSVKTGRGRA